MAPIPRTMLSVACGSLLALAGASVAVVQPAAAANLRLERVGTVPRLPARAHLLGPLQPRKRLHITVALEPRDPLALENYATAVASPGSASYRQYLTPAQFASRFGAAPSAIAAVQSALRTAGLKPQAVTPNGLAIRATAPAGTITRAFHTSLSRVRVPGATAIVNTAAPRLSARVASLVQGVVGLSSLGAPRPLLARRGAFTPDAARHATPHVVTGGPQPCSAATAAATAQSAYTIDQIASAYGFTGLYRSGNEGAGQTIALYELEPNDPTDVAAYQSCFGTSASVRYIPVDGGAGSGVGSGEAALDIETAIGLAPKASFLVYQAPNSNSNGPGAGPYDLFSEIITEDKAQVISASWGQCEAAEGATDAAAEATLFEEAAVQGQTFISASGDQGSADCFGAMTPGTGLAVDDPASQPFVTGVGGTKLQSIGPRPAETVWNQPCVAGLLCGSGASGGGISSLWSMPTYQAEAAASLHVVSAACGRPGGRCREVPDVSADGDPATGYVVYWNGSGAAGGETKWQSIGGTSAGAPTWAALVALANASSACQGSPIGFANPALYRAAGTGYASDFNDVVLGNNDFTGTNGGRYPAGGGYDMATGLGTPNATPLAAALCGSTLRVSNPGARSTTLKHKVTVPIHAADPGGTGLSYRATGLPAGLAINSASGVISGTPKRIQTTLVTVSVSDAQLGRGSTSFSWTIAGPPRVSNASIHGLTNGHPRLAFTLRSGKNGPALTAVTISPPRGLRFGPTAHGVTVTVGGKRVRRTASVKHGRLAIALAQPQTAVRVTASTPSLTVVATRVRLKFKLTPTDTGGLRTPLTARLTP